MIINTPKMDGREATQLVHSGLPQIRIIGLSMHADENQVATMVGAGASAYRSKGDNTDLLSAEIRGKVD